MTGFRDQICAVLEKQKTAPFGTIRLPLPADAGALVAVGWDRADVAEEISRLARWREDAQAGYASHFTVTETGTAHWLEELVLRRPDRALFHVVEKNGAVIGHLGINQVTEDAVCLIDNVIRGEIGNQPGMMRHAVLGLLDWLAGEGFRAGELVVLHDNTAAIRLYHNCGFRPVALEPLVRREADARVDWLPCEEGETADRFFLRMRADLPRQAG